MGNGQSLDDAVLELCESMTPKKERKSEAVSTEASKPKKSSKKSKAKAAKKSEEESEDSDSSSLGVEMPWLDWPLEKKAEEWDIDGRCPHCSKRMYYSQTRGRSKNPRSCPSCKKDMWLYESGNEILWSAERPK
jgi:hypothetical protein